MLAYSVFIEVEDWDAGSWTPEDANSAVAVTLADGSRWWTTFMTYENVKTLVERYKRSGEYLAGRYMPLCILVDQLTRQRVEEVIDDLIARREFEQVFRQVISDGEEAGGTC